MLGTRQAPWLQVCNVQVSLELPLSSSAAGAKCVSVIHRVSQTWEGLCWVLKTRIALRIGLPGSDFFVRTFCVCGIHLATLRGEQSRQVAQTWAM